MQGGDNPRGHLHGGEGRSQVQQSSSKGEQGRTGWWSPGVSRGWALGGRLDSSGFLEAQEQGGENVQRQRM